MANESLKNMLLNVKPGDYDKIMNHVITQEDIADFHNLCEELSLLEIKYNSTTLGRKEFAQELVKKLQILKRMSELITRELESKKNNYENASRELGNTRVENYDKALEVLRILASNENVQYEVKTINFPAYDSSDRYGYRETYEYTGEITILAEKEALAKFDCTKKLPVLTRDMLLEIYQKGFSMVLTGNDKYYTEKLGIPNQYILGYYHPLVFYLQDDNLANAILSFVSFIKENGADIQTIEVNDIVETIKGKYQKQLKLVKDSNNRIINL